MSRDKETPRDKRLRSMRTFDSGATRDSDDEKLDYDGFLSPLTLLCYAEFLHSHRVQTDGKMRDSDNWQKGIPLSVYMKSLWRHFMEFWTHHRSGSAGTPEVKESLCAVIFNASGYLHELLKKEKRVHNDAASRYLHKLLKKENDENQ